MGSAQPAPRRPSSLGIAVAEMTPQMAQKLAIDYAVKNQKSA